MFRYSRPVSWLHNPEIYAEWWNPIVRTLAKNEGTGLVTCVLRSKDIVDMDFRQATQPQRTHPCQAMWRCRGVNLDLGVYTDIHTPQHFNANEITSIIATPVQKAYGQYQGSKLHHQSSNGLQPARQPLEPIVHNIHGRCVA